MKLIEHMESPRDFNSKVLLYGDSKIGKTTFTATYTKGPLFYDFFDPNGPQALMKMVSDGQITGSNIEFEQIDYSSPKSFDAYWKALQKKEKDGLFKTLAANRGIYIVDSYTALNLATMAKTMFTSKNELPSQPDFRVNKGYIMNFIQTVTTLPCAVLVIAHTEVSKDDASGSVKILPMVTGSLKTSSGVFFDDLLFMKMRGKERVITTIPSNKANAGSRVLPAGEFKDLTMDDYYDCFVSGKLDKKFLKGQPKDSES